MRLNVLYDHTLPDHATVKPSCNEHACDGPTLIAKAVICFNRENYALCGPEIINFILQ